MLIIRRLKCIDAASGIVTLSKWPSGMQVEQEMLDLHTGWPLTESDDTRCCINTFQPPDDEHIMLETRRGLKTKLRGLSPRANYNDRAATAGRRS